MKRFHFDLGNSNTGPVGLSAVVYADTPEAAVAILRENLLDQVKADTEDGDAVAYAHVYVNPDNITIADIDEAEDGMTGNR